MYTPNFNDPRVLNRVRTALGFAIAVFSETESRSWSTRYIDKHVGQIQTPLGRYLRNSLLICTDPKFTMGGGKCKKYQLNPEGVRHLKEHIYYSKASYDLPEQLSTDWDEPIWDQFVVGRFVHGTYSEQLKTGNFDYRESHYRLFNDLQNVKTVYRKPILAEYGYKHNYDISCAAPTIIEQVSRRYGNDLWMPYYEEYLNNKTQVRTQLSKDFELDVKQTKVLINSLFCGARIGLSSQFSTSILLGNDVSKIMFAKEHEFLTGLREDIKTAWSYVISSEQEITRRRKLDTGRLIPVSSKDKWLVYFKYERYIMNVISRHLKEENLKFFLEHDGWSCDKQVDVSQIEQLILAETGFTVKLEKE